MIGFIKKLFSGILSFLVGLFAGKKSEPQLAPSSAKGKKSKGYFMELNEDEPQAVNGTQTIKAELNKAVDKTKELVAAATNSVASEPAKAKAEPAKAKAEPVKASVATVNNQPAKTEATASNPAAKVELVQTAEGVKAEPAKPTKASTASAKTQTETTFAPKYLAPTSTNGRRRPGPNMNTFLDMARQVKTPG